MVRILSQCLAFVTLMIALVACMPSYYFAQVQPDGDTGLQVQETQITRSQENVEVSYSFSHAYRPFALLVTNNSDSPIHIHWRESGLVVNGNMASYQSNTAKVRLDGRIDSSVSSAIAQGDIQYDAEVSTLPPNSSNLFFPTANIRGILNRVPRSAYHVKQILMDGEYGAFPVAYWDDIKASPGFRSYLTIRSDGGKKIVFDDKFLITAIIDSYINFPDAQYTYNSIRDFDKKYFGVPMKMRH